MIKFNWLIAFLFIMVVASACGEDDLKNAAAISSKKVALTRNRSYGVEVIYSDSAFVKAKGFAPVYDKVTPSTGSLYNEMPEGVKIEFFDAYLQVTGTITSKYAINNEADQITVFKKNVVVVNDQMTFTTEELTWDEKKKLYYSPSGTVVDKNGSVFTGAKFSAPQDFSTYTIIQGAGETYVKGDITP